MKWHIFTHSDAEGAASGTRSLSRFDFEGDDEGRVADEVIEELEEQGYQVVHVAAEPEPERRRGFFGR